MRTVLLWEGEDGVGVAFGDVEAIAASCRFRDCGHGTEPGCAVREALAGGDLDPARYRSYLKLRREARHQAMKTDDSLRREEQRRWRRIHLEARQRPDKRRI
jgi:ribosome biogenesis GTPase